MSVVSSASSVGNRSIPDSDGEVSRGRRREGPNAEQEQILFGIPRLPEMKLGASHRSGKSALQTSAVV